MISLFIAATDGKRAESADQARSAWARLANAPSWIDAALAACRLLRRGFRRLGLGRIRGLRFGRRLWRRRNRLLRHPAEVELGVGVLAGACLERRFALAGDIEPAGVGRLDLVGSRLRRGSARAAPPSIGGILPAEPEKGSRDEGSGEKNDQQRGEHPPCRNSARHRPRRRPPLATAAARHRPTGCRSFPLPLRAPPNRRPGSFAQSTSSAGKALRNGPVKWFRPAASNKRGQSRDGRSVTTAGSRLNDGDSWASWDQAFLPFSRLP